MNVGFKFTTGTANTLTLTVSLEIHPLASVPINVYDEFDEGVTKTVCVVLPIGFHWYVAAPLAVKLTVEPLQIV